MGKDSLPDDVFYYLHSQPHTDIGVSEQPGGTKTYCSPAGRYSSQQGQLPANFWSNVEFKSGRSSSSGGRYAQCEIVPTADDLCAENLESDGLHPAREFEQVEC